MIPARKPELTPREKEIAELVARAESNREIGVALGLSEHTISAHLRQMFLKLGCRNRTQLAVRIFGEQANPQRGATPARRETPDTTGGYGD